jgi:RNA polymerase sigma-70 factor (ECF subfamily)
MDDFELTDEMRDEQRAAWHRYVDRVAAFRPLLYGYCHKLTRNLWDAEDLAQETLLRGFHHLSYHHDPIKSARAYLLRIATHAWIDTLRRRETESNALAAQEGEPATAAPEPGLARDAGRMLLQRLAPREQAAVILKDLFDMSLEESAVVLETTVGAVKAALHRGRERLRESDAGPAARRPQPSPELLDRFVALYNAEDRAGLIDLVLDNATISNIGVGTQYGEESLSGEHSWIEGALGGHPSWPDAFRYEAMRASIAEVEGEPVVLVFRTRGGSEALELVLRLAEEDGRVSRILCYGFTPETVRAVGEALDLPVRTGLYRYPTREPGVSW